MTFEIYLIRHAETEVNVIKDRIGGRSNWAELAKNGIAQAKTLGDKFKNEGITFDAVYSSTAIRTQQTARYCLEAMDQSLHGVELEPSIVELSQGDWEGKPRNNIYSRVDVREGLDNDCWNYVPGDNIKGESQAAVGQRMKVWLEQIVEKHSKGGVAAFTHGLAIKYLLADLFDLDRTTAYKMPIDNTSVTIIRYGDGKPTCTKRNNSSHLERAGLSKVRGAFDDSKIDSEKIKSTMCHHCLKAVV